MTEKLPSVEQFKKSREWLAVASDAAFAVVLLDIPGSVNEEQTDKLKVKCIEVFKLAAADIGYELVQRSPATSETTDKEANAGGRLDIGAVADV